MSIGTHKLTFALVTLLGLTFWIFNMYNRIFLGKHTLDQVILGSQLGIWLGFFSHFVLRDQIFKYITRLTFKIEEMTRKRSIRYAAWGSFLFFLPILFTMIVGLTMNAIETVEQEWLINLRDRCDEKFDIDADGKLITNASGMYKEEIAEYALVFGYVGLYVG